MSRSRFPFHLQSTQSCVRAVCGNIEGVKLPWRSIKRVECKNCVKIMASGRDTAWYEPSDVQRERAMTVGKSLTPEAPCTPTK